MAVTLGTDSGFVTTAPTADPAGSNTVIDGASVVTKHTSPEHAVSISQIGWYRGSGTNGSNFEVGLYSEAAGIADARLNVAATNSSTSSGWITVSVNWSISGSTNYWLALQMDAHTGSSNVDSGTTGGAGYDRLTSQTTLNDPYGGGAVDSATGLYAIYALVKLQPNITPGVGELTLTGYAPTVSVSDNKNVLAGVGALDFTGFAPTWSTAPAGGPGVANPGTGELTLAGFAPTVSVTTNLLVRPDVGSLTLTGFEPTVATPRNVTPDVGALALTGLEPTVAVTTNLLVRPDVGVLTLTGLEPTVAVSNHITVLPDTGVLTLTGFAPTVFATLNQNVAPGTGVLTITGYAPTAYQTELYTVLIRTRVYRDTSIDSPGAVAALIRTKVERSARIEQ